MEGQNDLDLEIEKFKSHLKQTQDKVNFWRNEEVPHLFANQKEREAMALKDVTDQIEKYSAKVSSGQKENAMVNKKFEEKCVQLEKLKTELERLCEVTHDLNTQKAKGETTIDTVKQDIEKLQKDIAVPTEAKKKLEYLSKASEAFGARMGLKFKKTKGQRIQVIFTQIDEKDPLMSFYFFLKIEGLGRKYVVSDCEPQIEVDDLVKELNQTNNLRKFIIAMRNRFKETVK